MHFYLLIGCILASIGCSKWKRDKDPIDPVDPLEAGRAKAAVYEEHQAEARAADGSIHLRCDSLGFTALFAVARDVADRGLILSFRDAAGRWHRNVAQDCFKDGQDNGSKSTISGDHLLMLAWWAWEFRALDVVLDVIEYGKAHNWNMGEGDPFRTVMRPTLIVTYYDLARELGGDPGETPPDAVSESNLSFKTKQDLVAPTGFEAHLQVLHTLLRAVIHGAASDADLEVFKLQAERQPANAFFLASYHLYLDGDQSAAAAALGDDVLFPPDRLPTVADRCKPWVWEHDMSPDNLAPCPGDPRPHSGGDLRFALKVAENRIRKKGS